MTIAGRILFEKNIKMTPNYENGHEKGTLITQMCQKDTLSSDLLRSEPQSGILFTTVKAGLLP